MSGLRSLAELGFADAQSLLQSGNIVFQSDKRTGSELERLLEMETQKRLHMRADYFVRTSSEWKEIVTRNPFRDDARDDPSHLVVMFLKKAPATKDVEALQTSIKGPEIVRAEGKQAYIVYPEGIGRSKLTTALSRDRPQLEHGSKGLVGHRIERLAFSISTGARSSFKVWRAPLAREPRRDDERRCL
jgi:uncharacterized protein (DUF1697 family)